MKKVGQLMQDMGFNPDAADSAKEAFIKYLIKQSTGISVQTPSEKGIIKKIILEDPQKIVNFPQQLEFDLIEAEESSRKSRKKA